MLYFRHMWRRALGYTIIEVMMALAIGGTMLVSATVLLKGTRSETEFIQAMRDVDSKIQTIISGINSGSYNVSDRYQCALVGGRPYLAEIASGGAPHEVGTSSECLVLGRAIQGVVGKSQLYIRTVLGARYYTNAAGQKIAAANLFETKPTPATIENGGDLTETFTITARGAVLKSTSYNDGATRGDMAGIYYDPAVTTNRVTTQALIGRVYELQSSPSDPNANVNNFIQERPGYRSYQLSKWKLCFESNDGKRTGYLTLSVSAIGVNTELVFNNC